MEDKNMFFGIPKYLFASIFDEIIPDIITENVKKSIFLRSAMTNSCKSIYKEPNKYYFGFLSKISGDKINFAYIAIQFDPYKKYFPSDNKFSSSLDNFANKFKKICDMNNEFNNKNV